MANQSWTSTVNRCHFSMVECSIGFVAKSADWLALVVVAALVLAMVLIRDRECLRLACTARRPNRHHHVYGANGDRNCFLL